VVDLNIAAGGTLNELRGTPEDMFELAV